MSRNKTVCKSMQSGRLVPSCKLVGYQLRALRRDSADRSIAERHTVLEFSKLVFQYRTVN